MSKNAKAAIAPAAAVSAHVHLMAQALAAGETTVVELLAAVTAGTLSAADYGEIRDMARGLDSRKPISAVECSWTAPDGAVIAMLEFRGGFKAFRLSASKVAAVMDAGIQPAMKAFVAKHNR